MVNLKSPGRF